MKKNLFLFVIIAIALLVADFSYARDLSASVQDMGVTLKDFVFKLGIVFLIVAGGAFMVSMRSGIERFVSTIIGISVAASATTFVALAQRWFGN